MAKSLVLIVDDDKLARELLAERLQSEGYALVLAASGEEALERALERTPDVVLLDVMMPQMDGFETCRRFRRHAVLREVPILMITALDDGAAKLQGLEAGADDFLSKTCDPAELRARVRTITRLNRYRRLQEERAKFEWVVDQSDDGFLLLDETDAILYANPRARQLLGEAAAGTSFLDQAVRAYRCEPQDAWSEWPESEGPLYLLRPESRTSGALWLEVERLGLPAGSGHRLVRLRDETRRMGLGRNLWQLSALVSEKLDAPLTMTLGSLDMLADDIERYSESEVVRLAELARRSGRRLQEQIRHVLGLLDHPDRAPWEEGGVDLEALEPLVEDLAAHAGLGFTAVSLDDGVAGRIPLSPVAFELILREIFANAKAFHPAGTPSVRVEVAPQDDGDAPGRRQVVLRFRCDRSTVLAERMARAWMPYYRLADGERDDGGSGLGSSMIGNLVWGVGGVCRLHDDESGGVAMVVVLPLLPRS